MIIDIPGSPGELIDKITILELKARHFTDPGQRQIVARQLAALSALWRAKISVTPAMNRAIAVLRRANTALWDIEEKLRALEQMRDFGAPFIAAARAVYRNNDRRAAAKRAIDAALGAAMIEQKSYATGAAAKAKKPARKKTGEKQMSDATANLAVVRGRIAAAARAAHRDPAAVQLVAVSKTHGADKISALIGAGQKIFGENRVQEAEGKFPALKAAHPDLKLHLIGPLQTNKTREALALFDAIQSVDRPKLAEALAREMDRVGRRPDCFIQVNTGEEAQKAGVLPAALDALVGLCRATLALPLVGLMCIPPLEQEPSPHFALLAKMAARHGLASVSMGMSADYETAVRLGATHVRVGTALFGARAVAP